MDVVDEKCRDKYNKCRDSILASQEKAQLNITIIINEPWHEISNNVAF